MKPTVRHHDHAAALFRDAMPGHRRHSERRILTNGHWRRPGSVVRTSANLHPLAVSLAPMLRDCGLIA